MIKIERMNVEKNFKSNKVKVGKNDKKTKTENSTSKNHSKQTLTQFYKPVNPKVLSKFQSLFQDKPTELLAHKRVQQPPTKGKQQTESKPAAITVNLERNFT